MTKHRLGSWAMGDWICDGGPPMHLKETGVLARIRDLLPGGGSLLDDHSYNIFITQSSSCNQSIADMFFKIIGFAEYSSNPSLGIPGICILDVCLGNNCNFPVLHSFKSKS